MLPHTSRGYFNPKIKVLALFFTSSALSLRLLRSISTFVRCICGIIVFIREAISFHCSSAVIRLFLQRLPSFHPSFIYFLTVFVQPLTIINMYSKRLHSLVDLYMHKASLSASCISVQSCPSSSLGPSVFLVYYVRTP